MKFDLAKLRKSQIEPIWIADNDEGVELILGTEEDAIPEEMLSKSKKVLEQIDYAYDKAIHLLTSFMKDSGEWYLGTIDIGHQSKLQECDFLLDIGFEAENKPHEYTYTYFQVCFKQNENSPEPINKPHPFKFIVGFR